MYFFKNLNRHRVGCTAHRLRRLINTTHNTSAGGIRQSSEYCRDLVQKHDYESYLISHFWPSGARDAFFALKAFYIELAMVQDAVSQPVIGKMRMQFWRDAVKSITEDRPPQHPIALALHDSWKKARFAPYHLQRIIDARDAELDSSVRMTIDSVVAHAESTASTMLYLQLSLLSLTSSNLAHAASHLGVSQSIATLIRALPFHISHRRMVIPAEVTARHGVSQEDVFRAGPQAKGIEDAVFEFATVANDHLITAREAFKKEPVPREALSIFLTGVPVANFLHRLESCNFNGFDPSLRARHWTLPWQIWRGYYKRTF